MPGLDWGAKRRRQGFSYKQVRAEIDRRYKGECRLSPEVAKERYERALVKLERVYKLSATLNDLLDEEGMEYEDLVALIGTEDRDMSLAIALQAVFRPEGAPVSSIRTCTTVDDLYPGVEEVLDRDGGPKGT